MDTNTRHSQSSNNLASYLSDNSQKDTCLSADFRLDTIEIIVTRYMYSEFKCDTFVTECLNVMRHLPNFGFTSVVYSSLLIWCHPPPPKLDAQRKVHHISILNIHTYKVNCYRRKIPFNNFIVG